MRKLVRVSLLALIAVLALSGPALADDGTGWACWPNDCSGNGPDGPSTGQGTGGTGTQPSPPSLWGNTDAAGAGMNTHGIGDLINEEVQDIICGDCAPDLDTSNFDPGF